METQNKPNLHVLMDDFLEGLKPEIELMAKLYTDFVDAHNKQLDTAEELFHKMNGQYNMLYPVLKMLVALAKKSTVSIKSQEALYDELDNAQHN